MVLPDLDGGGAQRVAINLLRHLGDGDFRRILIVMSPGGGLADDIPNDVETILLDRARLRTAVFPLWRLLARLKPAVVFSTFGHLNLAILLLRMIPGMGRCRVLIREPNTPSKSHPALRYGWILSLGCRWVYPQADQIICQSDIIKYELQHRFRVGAHRLGVIHNAVDQRRIRQQAEPLCGRSGVPLYIAIGSLTYQKGFDRLIGLMSEISHEYELVIMGEGPMRGELTRLVSHFSLGSRIRIVGYQKNPWPLLGASDVLLISSRWEGMPNVALEALALGVPVIGTETSGGLKELVDLVDPGYVKVEQFGDDFRRAIEEVKPSSGNRLRSSVLPDRYDAAVAAESFKQLVRGMV